MSQREQRTAIAKVSFYADDWLSGTMDLNSEQRGAFITLCALYWSKKGRVPEDDHHLARMCGMSVRRWRGIKCSLIAVGKIEFIDGFLYQERAEIELINVLKTRDEHAENGRKGGLKSAEIRANALKRNKSGSSPASIPGQPTNTPTSSNTTKSNETLPPPEESVTAREPGGGGSGLDVPSENAKALTERFLELRNRHWDHPPTLPSPTMSLEFQAGQWLEAMPEAVIVEVLDRQMATAVKAGKPPAKHFGFYRYSLENASRAHLAGGAPSKGSAVGAPEGGGTHPDAESSKWDARVGGYARNGFWEDGEFHWGPRPDQPGCRAPAALLAAHGYGPGGTAEGEGEGA